MTALIQSNDWSILQGGQTLIQGIALQVHEGEWHHVTGNNNVGKSLMMECVSGNYRECKGQLKVLDYNMFPISNADLAHIRKRMGYASQSFRLLDDKTVRINLLMCLQSAERVFEQSNDLIINSLLDDFQMLPLLKREIRTLSYSEKQVVSILRALIHKPRLLLLDQCFEQLDPRTMELLVQRIVNLVKFDRVGVLSSARSSGILQGHSMQWQIKDKQITSI